MQFGDIPSGVKDVFLGETCRGRTFCEIKHERSIEVIKIVKGEGLFVFIKMISMKEKKKKTMLAQ